MIIVAIVASSIAIVVTLAIVFAVKLFRRYRKGRNMVKVDRNNDYGYYYRCTHRPVQLRIKHLFLYFQP